MLPSDLEVQLAPLLARAEAVDALHDDSGLVELIVHVGRASRNLVRLLNSDSDAFAVLQDLDTVARPDVGDAEDLRRWRQYELLRIAARDLSGLDDLAQTCLLRSDLADGIVRASIALAGALDDDIAVIAMGKLGALELNYSSDIDLLFVGGDDALALRIIEIARHAERVDVDLRPEGKSGRLTRSLSSYEAYWDRWAEPWERQALLKCRFVAGDSDLGGAFTDATNKRLWHHPLSADELLQIRSMKARSEAIVEAKGESQRELKRGTGGIRDIEFAVQLLQLVHGPGDAGIRSPSTLGALAELGAAGYIASTDARVLSDSYRFLRTVEHRLQLVDDQQVHTLPVDNDDLAILAKGLGFGDDRRRSVDSMFERELRRVQSEVRSIHERLYFRPLLEAYGEAIASGTTVTADSPTLHPAAASARLQAFGFGDADRTRIALDELTRGLTRRSRLMRQLLPVVLGWLSNTPDPQLGLLGLRRLATGEHRAARLVEVFRDDPLAAQRLCLITGSSAWMTSVLEHQPELIPELGGANGLTRRSPDDFDRHVSTLLYRREDEDIDSIRKALARFVSAERMRIGLRSLLNLDDEVETGIDLSFLAEAMMSAALALAVPKVPVAVLGLGKLGGCELGFSSDLDVVLVHGGSTDADVAEAGRVAEFVVRLINGTTPAHRIWALDVDLRPEGKNGTLIPSLAAARHYYLDGRAETWERQAMTRARFVAGDTHVGDVALRLLDEFVWKTPFDDANAREIRRMKARIETERIPAGEDPQFHLKLGRGSQSDVEWTAQLLLLRHGIRATGTREALDVLHRDGLLRTDDHAILTEAFAYCSSLRNRLSLLDDASASALPTSPERIRVLARSLGLNAVELRDAYKRSARRCRAVVERLFYAQ